MIPGQGISFTKLLYQPVFDRLGVWGTLTLVKGSFTILVLDKTIGASLPQPGGTVVETLTPLAEVMAADLITNGIVADSDLDGQTITLFPPGADTSNLSNGTTWNIISHKTNPSNMGVTDGTIFLQLEGDEG